MEQKKTRYTVLNLIENKILVLKNKNGQYYFPKCSLEEFQNNIEENPKIDNLNQSRWFMQLNESYLKEFQKINSFSNAYIYVPNTKITYLNGSYLNIDLLLQHSFTPESYPFLFGIASFQIQLEKKYTEELNKVDFLEYEVLDYNLWKENVKKLLDNGLYTIANKIMAYVEKSIQPQCHQYYNYSLLEEKNFIFKANHIIDKVHSIWDNLISNFPNEQEKYLKYCIKKGVCSPENILQYFNKFQDLDGIIAYFVRTNDKDMLAQMIVKIANENNRKHKKLLELLLKLNMVELSYKAETIISQLYYASYYIIHNDYQEALEILVDCYQYNAHNESEQSTYSSISPTQKYIMLFLIKNIYNLDLAEFIDGESMIKEIQKEYYELLNDPQVKKRVKSYYLKAAITHFNKYRTINLKEMTYQEKIIFAIHNMNALDFNKIISIIQKNINEKDLEILEHILYKNIYILENSKKQKS